MLGLNRFMETERGIIDFFDTNRYQIDKVDNDVFIDFIDNMMPIYCVNNVSAKEIRPIQ